MYLPTTVKSEMEHNDDGGIAEHPAKQLILIASYSAVLAWVLLVLCVLVFAYGAFTSAGRNLGELFVWCIGALVVVAGIYIVFAFQVRCAKCGKRVFVEGGGTKHVHAKRIVGLDHWASVVIDVARSRELTCMHCGQRYTVR